ALRLSLYARHAAQLQNTGSTLLPPGLVFSSEELQKLDFLQSCIPEERISNGDTDENDHIYVRRMVTDKPGELPKKVNRPFSDRILDILGDEKRRIILSAIFDSTTEYFIRRC